MAKGTGLTMDRVTCTSCGSDPPRWPDLLAQWRMWRDLAHGPMRNRRSPICAVSNRCHGRRSAPPARAITWFPGGENRRRLSGE